MTVIWGSRGSQYRGAIRGGSVHPDLRGAYRIPSEWCAWLPSPISRGSADGLGLWATFAYGPQGFHSFWRRPWGIRQRSYARKVGPAHCVQMRMTLSRAAAAEIGGGHTAAFSIPYPGQRSCRMEWPSSSRDLWALTSTPACQQQHPVWPDSEADLRPSSQNDLYFQSTGSPHSCF